MYSLHDYGDRDDLIYPMYHYYDVLVQVDYNDKADERGLLWLSLVALIEMWVKEDHLSKGMESHFVVDDGGGDAAADSMINEL